MGKRVFGICLIIIFINPVSLSRAAGKFHDGYFWCLSHYLRMQQAINRYEEIKKEGGWPTIPYGLDLKKNDSGRRVEVLIDRLKITGELQADYQNYDSVFDEEIEEAVKRFQTRHGLQDDGIVGYQTLRELNIPVEDRLVRMRINLERIRELSERVQDSFVLVNIPEFRLKIIEKGVETKSIRVIVGIEQSPTPVFNDEISYLVFNPPWNIPPKKVMEDILPKLKEDPEYLEKNNIKVFENWQEGSREINPENLSWDKLYSGDFSYKFQQEPGPFNEMGLIKFMFPNDYLVYIHDTPHRHLFGYQKRAFSSGCIRIERPVVLAEYCLKKNGWGLVKIIEVLESGQKLQVNLAEPIPVFIVYWTSWVSEEETINFREDIYQKDITKIQKEGQQ